MTGFLDKDSIPQIGQMWQEIFDEDKKIIKLFFKDIYPFCRTVGVKEQGNVLSSLFLLPCRLGEYSGVCVYCAMTVPEQRGKGLMKELLDFSYKTVKEEGLDFVFLVPAEKSLFEYYGKCGFIPFGKKQTVSLNGNYPIYGDIQDCSDEEYIRFRELNLKNTSELQFDCTAVKYWVSACRNYGGQAVKSNNACALIFPNDDTVFLRDVTGCEKGIKSLFSYAEGRYPNAQITAEGMDFSFLSNAVSTPAGMIKTDNTALLRSDYYIGITLE